MLLYSVILLYSVQYYYTGYKAIVRCVILLYSV